MSQAAAVVVVPSIAVDALVERCVAECHRVAPGVEVVLLGGVLRRGSPDLTGPVTEHCLELFAADLAFQGADAIGTDGSS